MKKTLFALVAALSIFAATTPARAGYWETAVYAGSANQNLATGWFYATLQLHYEANYSYIDWSLIYNAWVSASAARDNALNAYWSAPYGSYAEYYALEAYYYLAAAADNLWMVYAYGGQYPSYATDAIIYAYLGQGYLSAAAQYAALQY